jgi:F-type H+-transporting ATPase subunit delta
MRSTAAARRYARALFAIAREEDRVEAMRGELDALSKLLGEIPELRDAIFRPLHPGAERRAVLIRVCERLGTSRTVRNFCAFLVDQRRVIDLEAIGTAFGQLADQDAGRVRAEVVSASPLPAGQRERLRSALSARTGKQVEFEERVDPALLAGVVASVGGFVFDGSLRTQLEQLRTSLTRGQ